MNRVGKLLTFLAAIAAIIWACLFIYNLSVLTQAPFKPEPSQGNVVPWSNHGVIHYVTEFDFSTNNKLFSAAVGIVALGFVGLLLWRGRKMFDRR